MQFSRSDRGFEFITHAPYPPDCGADERLVSQSSVIGDYEDAMDRPGSSALWIGEHHHLNREEVAELVAYLTRWMATGHLIREPRDAS